MIVCHCRAMNDRELRSVIEGGALDLEAIAEVCGAGARCGGCEPMLADLLRQTTRRFVAA